MRFPHLSVKDPLDLEEGLKLPLEMELNQTLAHVYIRTQVFSKKD
jgi:hypothetical protein